MRYLLPNEFSEHPGHRLGLLPAREIPHILMSDYLTSRAGMIKPASVNHMARVPTWCMGGNNLYGTCGPTAYANYMIMAYQYLINMQIGISDLSVFSLYRQSGNPDFNPIGDIDDNGVDLYTMLMAAIVHGMTITHPDGSLHLIKPACIAAVDSNNVAEMQVVTALMGGVICGVTLYVAQQAQVATGLWTYVEGSQDNIWGGHAIMGASYTGATGGPDESFVTWQQPIATSDSFITEQNQQTFAVILPIHLSNPGFGDAIAVKAMLGDFQAITQGQDW
jgi:hypothetical protein